MSWHSHMSLGQLAWRRGHITGDQVAGLRVSVRDTGRKDSSLSGPATSPAGGQIGPGAGSRGAPGRTSQRCLGRALGGDVEVKAEGGVSSLTGAFFQALACAWLTSNDPHEERSPIHLLLRVKKVEHPASSPQS